MKKVKLNYSKATPLPNNFLAEQAVLNILLTNPSLIRSVLPNLSVNCFYFPTHKLIYTSIIELSEKNKTLNLTLLISYLQDLNKLKEIGGIESIVKILNRFENFSDLDEYIKLLNEKYLRRLIIEFGKEIITIGYINTISVTEIINKIENFLFKLNKQNNTNRLYSTGEILDSIFEEMKSKMNKEENTGLNTSYRDLDSILQGFQKSDLVIIAGRPSMGKTAFSLNLAKKIVDNYELSLLVFSLEMSRQQIIYRFIATEAQINNNRLKSNKMTSQEWKKLSNAMINLSNLPIFIDDNPNLTIADIRSKIRKVFIEKKKTGLIIIDYLQLMKLNTNMENRVQEISYITRNLKILAKEYEIPIIILSQLSRSVESRVNKRPMLSDLRESGCIEKTPEQITDQHWNITDVITKHNVVFDFKGIKPTFEIIFDNNSKFSLTANHKILSQFGWISISQLQKGIKLYCVQSNQKKRIQYTFKTIKNIRYNGLNKVFDKQVPKYHNYIRNGFILHNSIEQDADIVIMLYRDDYYNDKNNNSNITEFIVAKHRNGPLGTARLMFNPQYTSFENL